ncbi:MAG TPA: enoyl-CoA hydratase [Gammaproteobacteria bacterium]|nr:enoyl-CoA hydratase [Gammaproteobacteria bacterium]
MNDTVQYQAGDGVATITLNRPDKLNAMNPALIGAAVDAIQRAASDEDVRVVVLTGAGRGFCVGGDLSAGGFGGDLPLQGQVARLRGSMRSAQLLHEMPKVTIAAINGACAGAGLSWACACDLRYAARSAKFTTAFLNAGLSGDFGGTWSLPRIVGDARARELYLLADRFDARDAEHYGLVSQALPDEDLMEHVETIARRLAASPPLALARIKANLNDAQHVSFSEALDREAERHVRCANTEDHREAARAFLEKRPGVYRGR